MFPILQNNSISLWRKILKTNITKLEQLADLLEWSEEQRAKILRRPNFPLLVPLRLAKKMAKGTLEDPLVKQFVPMEEELEEHPLFVADPVCDALFQTEGKLLQKYEGRVLLVCTSACAMHCRYCFRQNYPYDSGNDFAKELSLIEQDPSIHEVILSGGDPLSLSNEKLAYILHRLSKMDHIKRIRFHTRFLIGIPERIDEQFLELLAALEKQVIIVIHCNHKRELDQDIFDKIRALQKIGCVMLNQAVLLKGVNDNVATLTELGEELANHGVFFYYLHQLDQVKGAVHFSVSENEGRYLLKEMTKKLPGYAVPKYVREIAGEPSKTGLIT